MIFCTAISEGLLARIVAETCSKLHVRNSVWTAPARADRMLTVFPKTHPGATFLKNFGVILGDESRYFGDFGADDGTFFRRWVRSRCQGYGIVGPQPQLTSSQRSKSIYPARHMIRSSVSMRVCMYSQTALVCDFVVCGYVLLFGHRRKQSYTIWDF